jgi:ribosomal protein L16 Arg81 hydroxylase
VKANCVALAELLHPYDVQTFLKQTWTQKSLLIRGDRQKFAYLFSWQQLNELLNYHQFEFPTMRLALDEKVLDPSENQYFLKHCQEGATLILDSVHKLIPEIAQLTAALRFEMGHPVQMNSYCSMPGRQGFRCHYDTHEVFILQIDGSKQWTVFSDTMKYPLRDQKSVNLASPDASPCISCVLQPGDLLYIPRGHWHYAVATQQPSLHLTLGVLCKTGIDLLEWLISELKEDEQWRQNLPLLLNNNSIESIDTLVHRLINYLNQHKVAQDYVRSLNATERSRSPYHFPQQLGFEVFPQGVQTRFRRPPFQFIDIDEREAEIYQIRGNGKEITLKGIPKIVIDRLFHSEQFTGAEVREWLPEFDWIENIAPLISQLVKEGFLFVETP